MTTEEALEHLDEVEEKSNTISNYLLWPSRGFPIISVLSYMSTSYDPSPENIIRTLAYCALASTIATARLVNEVRAEHASLLGYELRRDLNKK